MTGDLLDEKNNQKNKEEKLARGKSKAFLYLTAQSGHTLVAHRPCPIFICIFQLEYCGLQDFAQSGLSEPLIPLILPKNKVKPHEGHSPKDRITYLAEVSNAGS